MTKSASVPEQLRVICQAFKCLVEQADESGLRSEYARFRGEDAGYYDEDRYDRMRKRVEKFESRFLGLVCDWVKVVKSSGALSRRFLDLAGEGYRDWRHSQRSVEPEGVAFAAWVLLAAYRRHARHPDSSFVPHGVNWDDLENAERRAASRLWGDGWISEEVPPRALGDMTLLTDLFIAEGVGHGGGADRGVAHESTDSLMTIRNYFETYGRPEQKVQKGRKGPYKTWRVGKVSLETALAIGRRAPYNLREASGAGKPRDPYKYRLSDLHSAFLGKRAIAVT